MNYDFKQLADEIHHRQYKTEPFRHVNVEIPDTFWTADQIDMNDVKEWNDKYRYILVVLMLQVAMLGQY